MSPPDAGRLRESFDRIAALGDQFAVRFYAELESYDLRHPGLGLSDLFPVSMAAQRKRFARALVRIVAEADRLDVLTPSLQEWGATHYHRDVTAGMYGPIGKILLETLKWALDKAWPEVAADWSGAYGLVAGVMTGAAEEEAKRGPATWPAAAVSVTRPQGGIAILSVGTDPQVRWQPGGWLEVETPSRPRVWWRGCPANLPDGRGVAEFHVRAAGRGGVSDALACLEPRAPLRIGQAGGAVLDGEPGRDLVMAAASTGIAPVLAVLRHLAALPAAPLVIVLYGAEHPRGLYALGELEGLAARCPWLTLIPVTGTPLHEVIARDWWASRDGILAGPRPVVKACAAALAAAGMPPERIRALPFGRGES